MAWPEYQKEFIEQVFDAARACDLDSFYELVGSPTNPKKLSAEQLNAIRSTLSAEEGNSICHELLTGSFLWRKKQRRNIRVLMLERLLQEEGMAKVLNRPNFKGQTALHLAVINDYHFQLDSLIGAGAKITSTNAAQATPLELAAEHQKPISYKKLYEAHKAAIKKLDLANSYSCTQLEAAASAQKKRLQSKKQSMGILGTIMSIACPVGAILAFTEWPLLNVFFAMLLGGAGPVVGVVSAVVLGGLLFWTFYNKNSKKYGIEAQQNIDIDTTLAKIDRLEMELKRINKLEQSGQCNNWLATKTKENIDKQLQAIYSKVSNTIRDPKADRTTTSDEVQTVLSAGAGFLCAFSGVLGILGAAASQVPAWAFLGIVPCLGVPIGGWCALGIALVVAAVGTYVYYSKMQNSLQEKDLARDKAHNKLVWLTQKKTDYDDEQALKAKATVTAGATPTPDQSRLATLIPGSVNESDTLASLAGKRGFHQTKVEPAVTGGAVVAVMNPA